MNKNSQQIGIIQTTEKNIDTIVTSSSRFKDAEATERVINRPKSVSKRSI